MLVRGVIDHEVKNDANTSLLALRDQLVHVGQRAIMGVHVFIVRHVIAEIDLGRRKHGREPDGIDAQPVQVVEF